MGGFHRGGPPWVRGVRSVGGGDTRAKANKVAASTVGVGFAIKTLSFSGVPAAGIRIRLKPLVFTMLAALCPTSATRMFSGAMRIHKSREDLPTFSVREKAIASPL